MKNSGFIVIFLIICSSCFSSWTHVEVYSPAKDYVITIITKDSLRYIVPEKTNKIPKTGYAVVNINSVDPIGDEIGICWDRDGYEIQLVSAYSTFIENTIINPKIKIYEELDKEDGVITMKRYIRGGCVSFMIRENRLYPEDGAIIKYKWF